ncbi:hypothetical protein DSO57_1032058 [Entomophthora muscae]|uniref:Uncharacterized protein n=1 Tax=Entomophthora muscae TaxID=34485 RepID=A0ACC2SD89_9FUNG|nr:hypothetical protein DSO57_1032058 [Entomophthora muscae]
MKTKRDVNIPDINQILTEGKSWGKIGESSIQEAKFDKEFPPLFGENKNKIEENPDFSRRQINLSSGQAPAATAQTPSTPASTLPAPSQPPAAPRLPASRQRACLLPGSQGPSCNQSETLMKYSQSKESLNKRKNSETKITPSEEGGNNNSDFKNKFATNQLDANSQTTWAGSNSNQNNVLKTKIDLERNLVHIPHLAPGQHEIISSPQELLNQPQIAGVQEFGHLPKPQLLSLSSKLLGFPIPNFSLPIANLCTGESTINEGSLLISLIQPPSNPRKMNFLIFTAVLTACLGIGGYQQGSELFGPSSEGLGCDPNYNPGQLNSSHTGPWPPLVSPYSTLSIAMYTSMYYILT